MPFVSQFSKDELATMRGNILADLGKHLKQLNPKKAADDEVEVCTSCQSLLIRLIEMKQGRVSDETINLYLSPK
jgi:hypothetical protein